MKVEEFSAQFDLLFNNITSNQAPGLNEYEKSVFLTKAQNEIIKNYLLPQSNPKQAGFDDNAKRQIDFSTLMKRNTLVPFLPMDIVDKFDSKSIVFPTPDDLFIIRNEQLLGDEGSSYTVVPISFEEYDRVMSKPYKYPPKNQAWRLFTDAVIYKEVSSEVTGWDSRIKANIVMRYLPKEDYTIKFQVTVGPMVESSITHEYTSSTKALVVTVYQNSAGPTVNDLISNIKHYVEENIIDYFKEFFINGGGGPIASLISDESAVILNVTKKRLTTTTYTLSPAIEIRGKFNTPSVVYKIRYIRKPKPIILINLEDGLEIEGEHTAMTSELPAEIHDEILQRAVELAKITWAGEPAATVQAGQRSE